MKMLALLLLVSMIVMGVEDLHAQAASPTGVYITTQDFVSLRTGPGRAFTRIAVIPPTITLPALGRTSDVQWVQVEYEGARGWIAALWLVWSGDVIELPVDGVDPAPFVRRAAATGFMTRDAPYYLDPNDPFAVIGMIPAGTGVELTGRLGETGFFKFQVRYDGGLYWVGSWDVNVTDGDYRRLLDLAYLYPYGRLVNELSENLAFSLSSYRQILDVWGRLRRGDFVACSPIPLRIEPTLSDADVTREPLFLPAAIALNNAVTAINGAIAAFEDGCRDPNFVLTIDIIRAQLTALESAERNLIVVGSLLEPLRVRNPLYARPS
jgi:uncharacterized protein YraI